MKMKVICNFDFVIFPKFQGEFETLNNEDDGSMGVREILFSLVEGFRVNSRLFTSSSSLTGSSGAMKCN